MNNNYYAKLAKNKSLLKEYKTSDCDRTVYLNDGDEFQIQLFNPETTEICARIFIEDTQMSHDIVIRPGERMWLERYTDRNRKFKFETYVVDGRDAKTRFAISHNGIIKIEFFRKEQKINNAIWVNQPHIYWTNDNWHYNDYTITCDCNNSINSVQTALNATNNANSSINTMYYSTSMCNPATPTGTITVSTPSMSTAIFNPEFHKDTKNLETGRVSDGSKSKQKFDNVDMDFQSWPFKTETIKIFPESRKPYNSNDLKKIYCSNCGRKLNTKYKYCPYCGEKID